MGPILCGLACENRNIWGSLFKRLKKLLGNLEHDFFLCKLYPLPQNSRVRRKLVHLVIKKDHMQIYIQHLLCARHCAKNREHNGKKKTVTGQKGQSLSK